MARTAVSVPAPAALAIRTDAPRAVLIGTAGTLRQCRELLAFAPDGPEPIGCIVVDGMKRPRAGGGLPVLGALEDLPAAIAARSLTLAIVSLPMAMADTINRVRAILREHGVQERFIPPVQDLLAQAPPFAIGLGTPAGGVSSPRIDVAELIGRPAHPLDRASIARILTAKRVLITGAGGSIGSEIARIVAEFNPAQLQLVERAENPLFEIDRQIARRFPALPRRAILHDVVDPQTTRRLLADLRPDTVFHAAAHKHVPLMEDHPAHAVNNNLFGTRSIADAAVAARAERFVMVSSDKAVNPTSVMGATKRLAELYIQSLHTRVGQASRPPATPTRFSMVRFGNVLGSACSVLTIWSAQLAEGGPITVTDPRMTRYFMTIAEAAGLVIQAAAIDNPPGSPAAVHVLDMGRPIPILTLADRFVRAHGFAPRFVGPGAEHVAQASHAHAPAHLPTVDILITGIRPGEKLHEELAYSAENLRPTPYPGISAWTGAGGATGSDAMIADLAAVRASTDRQPVLDAIRRHVPEMSRPPA